MDPRLHSCHLGGTTAIWGNAYQLCSSSRRKRIIFPFCLLNKGKVGFSHWGGPPSHNHSPFPSLVIHTALVPAQVPGLGTYCTTTHHPLPSPHTGADFLSHGNRESSPRSPIILGLPSSSVHQVHLMSQTPAVERIQSFFPVGPPDPMWSLGMCINFRCQRHHSLGTVQSEHLVNRVSVDYSNFESHVKIKDTDPNLMWRWLRTESI